MAAIQRLKSHLEQRASELKQLKAKGAKIIGYIPSGYVPEEMLWASGAIPIGLIRGGDHAPVAAAEAYLQRFVDTFARAQIGYRVGGEPLYQLPDLIVGLTTDRNILIATEMWLMNTKVDTFKYGVPSRKDTPQALVYYRNGLNMLRQKLEAFTGKPVTDDAIHEQILISNRIRTLLEEISNTRQSVSPPLSGADFVLLNHATYLADRKVLLEALENISLDLKKARPAARSKKPRLMLTGSTLAYGDNKLVDLLEKSGADIVIEEFSEGIRHYWQKVSTAGDPLAALVDCYLVQRPAPAFFKKCKEAKFNFLFKLIADFKVDGVVWYSLLYRDSYDRWGVSFPQALEKKYGIPFLKINSDYDPSEDGMMRTRVEAFLETIAERR